MDDELATVQRRLTQDVHEFVQPTANLHSTFLSLAKHYLDPLAEEVSQSQQQRLTDARQERKRKRRSDQEDLPRESVLRVKRVHIDGFDIDQVWQQARRVLDAAANELEQTIPVDDEEDEEAEELQSGQASSSKAVRFEDELSDDDEALGTEGVDYEVEGEDDGEEAPTPDSEDDDDAAALSGDDELEDEDIDSQTSISDADEKSGRSRGNELVKDKFGLNDGFFSIDQFNKQTEFLESQDARGDPDDGAASDEEEVDWSNDPMMASVGTGKAQKTRDAEDDDADDDEGGATFGNADLNAPDSDSDGDGEDDGGVTDMAMDLGNTNDVLYADFFAPPARQKGKNERRQRNKPAAGGLASERHADGAEEEDETDVQMQRAMADVERDLLDDDDDGNEDLSQGSEDDEMADEQELSTHERRMKAFNQEIKRLEKENLEKREWALLGETVAPARPENALLEEDLDFERAGKPVPVATEEVNESIEELIKRRILNNDFDELTRRRPELQDLGARSRGLAKEEISDVKSSRGLAEEYEDDYLRKNDPNYVDKRSEATKKAHAEIAAQWLQISAQLDALSNYHYKPRPPETTLDVRTAAPVIQMEEARPTAGADAQMSGLAAQEVYRPGQDGATAGQMTTKGGTIVAKEEESRESRRRRRNRDKARAKKAGTAVAAQKMQTPAAAGGDSRRPKKADKQEMMKSLKKGNVKVIGKKGELHDVEGNAVAAAAVGSRSQARATDLML